MNAIIQRGWMVLETHRHLLSKRNQTVEFKRWYLAQWMQIEWENSMSTIKDHKQLSKKTVMALKVNLWRRIYCWSKYLSNRRKLLKVRPLLEVVVGHHRINNYLQLIYTLGILQT